MLMHLRQLVEALCSLPVPPGMVWHDPGKSLQFSSYHVADDSFFSGHSAIAVLGALELSRFRRTWLTATAILLVLLEVATVLILRAHYTMDVVTGILAALWIARLSERLSPALERSSTENR